jgi:S-DNA-T family DNA segregation ATPase FtsK/SpoIIIE
MAAQLNKNKSKQSKSTEGNSSNGITMLKIRMGLSITFILLGIINTLAIISYFFTWKQDSNLVRNNSGFWNFLFHETTPVANWCGKAGAWIAHELVFNMAGIAALTISLFLVHLGIAFINYKRFKDTLKLIRWMSYTLLFIAPTLTYIGHLSHSSFPWGGAWGNSIISHLNLAAGTLGTGLILFAMLCMLCLIVFSLDIKPFLASLKASKNQLSELFKKETHPLEDNEAYIHDKEQEEEEELESVTNSKLFVDDSILQQKLKDDDEDDDFNKDGEPIIISQTNYIQGQEISDEELALEASLKDNPIELITTDVEETVIEVPSENEVTTEVIPDLTFEVIKKHEEASIPAHGAHISIADKEPYAPELDLPDYKFPTLDLLKERSTTEISVDKEELEKNKNQIIQTLKSFGIEIQRISATVGPTVTLYEIVPAEGVRISKIRNLEDDIALNLAALGIRIIAPIPGRGTIGIEVPNMNKQMVSMRTLLSSEKFINSKMSLPIALGKKIDNENYILDLATLPHLLMAGATGQGKSVGINAILVSLLYKKHPSQLKFVLIDPKKVELSIYRTIEKHFLAKLPNEEEAIITDTKKVVYTINALCIEMDNRYELLKEAGARNIKEYNEKFISRSLNPQNGHRYLPFIVLVIDEFADLIMTAGKEVEMPIARLAQLARAIGIHLIIATQRPSVNVITGIIKANFPGRIAFKVSAKVDSRTILDTGGAEQLIGSGDMLVSHGSELLRLQCAFVDTNEVEKIVDFIGSQRGYPSAFELPEYEGEEGNADGKNVDLQNRDKLFEDCARLVVQTQSGSTSNLQRKFNLGYNRAGRIMDQLEAAGIVGPAMGSKPRDVYFKTEMEVEQFLSSLL